MGALLEIKRKPQAEQASEAAPAQPPAARDIGAIYKAAQAYHARHNPPQAGAEYWEWSLKDLQATATLHDNDPLIKALLSAALADLEREHKRLLAAQDGA